LQTALLKAPSPDDETLARGFTVDTRPISLVGNAGFGAAALGPNLLIELEATPGIEPGYTVLQAERAWGCSIARDRRALICLHIFMGALISMDVD